MIISEERENKKGDERETKKDCSPAQANGDMHNFLMQFNYCQLLFVW